MFACIIVEYIQEISGIDLNKKKLVFVNTKRYLIILNFYLYVFLNKNISIKAI